MHFFFASYGDEMSKRKPFYAKVLKLGPSIRPMKQAPVWMREAFSMRSKVGR